LKLLQDSHGFFKNAVEKRGNGMVKEGYEQLRSAVEYLKRAYLDQTKPKKRSSLVKPKISATRSKRTSKA
jgi:hypothetical protein